MTALLIALLVFVVTGFAATTLLRKRLVANTRVGFGLEHLTGLRWREFTRLVLHAMHERGYRVLKDDSSPGDELPGDGGDILLERDGQRVLLLCKYGNASVVGAPPILGLGKAAELRGAHAALVVTPGRFDDEARRVAALQHVELIDGASLWPEVEPFLDHTGRDHAARLASGHGGTLVVWMGAAALGAIAWFLSQGMFPAPDLTVSPAPSVAQVAPPVAPPARVNVATASPTDAVPTDSASLARRRNETASAISALAGVDRAFWSTQSTLLVHLASEDADPSARLCPLLERYPELAASRVQLQPPQDSLRSVRFRQCRMY